jgi:hypothetical protein
MKRVTRKNLIQYYLTCDRLKYVPRCWFGPGYNDQELKFLDGFKTSLMCSRKLRKADIKQIVRMYDRVIENLVIIIP